MMSEIHVKGLLKASSNVSEAQVKDGAKVPFNTVEHRYFEVHNYATRAQIKCNTFAAVLLCTYSVFDKFEITGLI